MVRRNLKMLAVLAVFAACAGAALGATLYASPPPGTAVQSVNAYLAGKTAGAFAVVASRVALDPKNKDAVQWYLSVYRRARGSMQLAYRSPGDKAQLLSRVVKAHGAPLYFPHQTLKIVGVGALVHPFTQQAVVRVDEIGADCGSVTVAVIGATMAAGNPVAPLVRVQNFCDLNARIQGKRIVLTGPYYAKNAALCCPTKPQAVAYLSFNGRTWIERPNYFPLHR